MPSFPPFLRVPVKEHTMVLPEIKEEQDENSEETEHFFGSTSLGSITAENGLIDGKEIPITHAKKYCF